MNKYLFLFCTLLICSCTRQSDHFYIQKVTIQYIKKQGDSEIYWSPCDTDTCLKGIRLIITKSYISNENSKSVYIFENSQQPGLYGPIDSVTFKIYDNKNKKEMSNILQTDYLPKIYQKVSLHDLIVDINNGESYTLGIKLDKVPINFWFPKSCKITRKDSFIINSNIKSIEYKTVLEDTVLK